MVTFFGFEIKRKQEETPSVESFAPRIEDDGAAVVVASGGAYGTYVDLEGTAKTEAELVTRYRDLAQQPEVEEAIDSIVDEAMDTDDDEVVSINLDRLEYKEKVKEKIREEFEIILKMLNFNLLCHDLFKRWYIDGRLYYHVIIDTNKPEVGIKELRYLDPRKIRKIREIEKKRQGNGQAQIIVDKVKTEYFIYNDRGFDLTYRPGTNDYGASAGIKIAKDSIIHCTSGILDKTNSIVLSHLHKAIRPMNTLRSVEDATVIYTLARAPERRIFYIDVDGLPKGQAEKYMRDMMTRHKNKLVYDQTTGEIRDDRRFMSMLEDYWFPRKGTKTTEVVPLPGGGTLISLDNIEYFQKKLYKSLNVPITRLQSEGMFNIGRSSEITRDEVKFSKFISRLRKRFSMLFLGCLEKQLVLKRVMSIEEWEEVKGNIKFDFAIDNFFSELKHTDILQSRLEVLDRLAPHIGKYYSHKWTRKNVLMQSDEDIEEIDKEIAAEKESEPDSEQEPSDDGQFPEQDNTILT